MKHCNKCNFPETYETIEFDKSGTCNICYQHQFKKENINWEEKKIEFQNIIDSYKNKYDYDCIIPFSGGKDSTYTLYKIVNDFRLKPLVVQFNHGFMRSKLIENNTKTFKKLGVDVISFTPNWKIVKYLMLESLIRKGDFCWHCHTGIFSYPMRIAVNFNIPLIIWGEPSSEYTAYYGYDNQESEEVDETRFNRFINLGITSMDMKEMLEDKNVFLDKRDLIPYTYPELRDLKKINYRSICLGSYYPWDVKKQTKIIMDNLGWEGDQVEGMPWEKYPYEKIECYMQGVRDYIKYLKRGYSRVTQMTALDIRNGRMSNEEAKALIDEYEGKKPRSLEIFLDYLNISEDEFNQIVSKTVVPPNKPNFKDNKFSEKVWDFENWYREDK